MKLVFWDNSVKAHLVPDDLVRQVDQELRQRFQAFVVTVIDKRGQTFRIDRGGAMLMSAKWVAVEIDGTIIEVPVRDIECFYMRLMEAPARIIPGTHCGYYKMHGELHAIVLSPRQRKVLLKAWSLEMHAHVKVAREERERFTAAIGHVAARMPKYAMTSIARGQAVLESDECRRKALN